MEGVFRNMLGPWQWALLAMVPPAIIALYFLKLKRAPLEVPSTYLWKKSIEDLHVNSIWQRLRQSLLLFLQLLLVALAILALLRPGWSGMRLSGDRFIFLIDNSASMSAKDVAPSRLKEAKRRTAELIDEMPAGAKAMIISFSDSGQVAQEFTDNRRQLRRRLQSIQPTTRGTSLRGALELASGLANPGRTANEVDKDVAVAEALPADVYIFSDGKFEDVSGFSLGNLTPHYVPIGESDAENLAVTALSTRRHETAADQRQAFARLANFGSGAVDASVSLYLNDQLIDSDQQTLEPGKERSVVFDLGAIDQGALRLLVENNDPLSLDNTAFAPVNAPSRAKVLLITPGNEALVLALSTERIARLADVETATPAVLAEAGFQKKAAAGAYDLIIFDQCAPPQAPDGEAAKMPLANTVFVGRLPPTPEWQGNEEVKKVDVPQIIDTNRAQPLFQLIDLGNVDLGDSLVVTPPPGGVALIESSGGTLCAIAPREGFEDLVFGFEIFGEDASGQRYVNTNWPRRTSFPAFWYGAIAYFGGQERGDQTAMLRPGQPVRLPSMVGVDQLEVVTPEGEWERVERDADGQFRYRGAEQLGVYEVRSGDKTVGRLAVNLFDPAESDIRSRPEKAIQIGYVDVEGKTTWEGARHELWKALLLAALVVLLFEWYIYNRRVYI